MKKIFFTISLMLIGMLMYNQASALTKVGGSTNYNCDGSEGVCRMISPTTGNCYPITIPGHPSILGGGGGGTLPIPPFGYTEYNNYFLFTNADDYTTGVGVINGYIHTEDEGTRFTCYDVDTQTNYTSFEEWEANLPSDTNPE